MNGLVAHLCPTLWDPRIVAHQAPLPMEFPRQEYWRGLHFLLQGIFPTQGLNPGLLPCRQILYHLSHQKSPLVTGILIKKRRVEKRRDLEEKAMWRWRQRLTDSAPSQVTPGAPDAGRPKEGSSPRFSPVKRMWPCWHPGFRLLASRILRE